VGVCVWGGGGEGRAMYVRTRWMWVVRDQAISANQPSPSTHSRPHRPRTPPIHPTPLHPQSSLPTDPPPFTGCEEVGSVLPPLTSTAPSAPSCPMNHPELTRGVVCTACGARQEGAAWCVCGVQRGGGAAQCRPLRPEAGQPAPTISPKHSLTVTTTSAGGCAGTLARSTRSSDAVWSSLASASSRTCAPNSGPPNRYQGQNATPHPPH
jgi:hypothetical protein